jgi:choloylglycine hydrolase
MRTISLFLLAVSVIFTTLQYASRACTEVRLKSEDNSVVIGRSMEFAQTINSNIVVQPRGQEWVSALPDGRDGMKWTSKYGIMYLDGFGTDIAVDGMNETGLSLGALFFPGEAQYQEMKGAKRSRTMTVNDLPRYILENFSTVDEVREALPKLTVVGIKTPQMGNIIIPAHISVYEPDGKGIIVEYTKDGLNIYDSMGIMTNSPAYPWHVTNLRNYVDLTNVNVKPVVIDGVSFAATGQGSGLNGIPGNPTPPARFVRAAAMAYLSAKAKDAGEAVNLAEHIMNTVDIPLGTVRDFNDKESFGDYTQWVVVKDLTNRVLYFRTYNNLSLRSVDMKKFDMSPGARKHSMPVDGDSGAVTDVTDGLTASN